MPKKKRPPESADVQALRAAAAAAPDGSEHRARLALVAARLADDGRDLEAAEELARAGRAEVRFYVRHRPTGLPVFPKEWSSRLGAKFALSPHRRARPGFLCVHVYELDVRLAASLELKEHVVVIPVADCEVAGVLLLPQSLGAFPLSDLLDGPVSNAGAGGVILDEVSGP